MMVAEASELVRAPRDVVREAVLDPAAYASDTKVGQITVHERTPAWVRATIHGHLGPFRSAIEARYDVAEDRVDLTMLSGRLRGFHALFLLAEEAGGTRLTHREEYDFGYGWAGPLLDRLLRGWAHRSVVAEVRALRRHAEAAARPGGATAPRR